MKSSASCSPSRLRKKDRNEIGLRSRQGQFRLSVVRHRRGAPLGLKFLLGRHADLQASARFFAAIYPDDPSAGYLAAAELALQGKLAEARAKLASLQPRTDAATWTKLNDSLPLFAAAARQFDLDTFLASPQLAMPKLDIFTSAKLASEFGTSACAPPSLRVPSLPCMPLARLFGAENPVSATDGRSGPDACANGVLMNASHAFRSKASRELLSKFV